LLWKINVEIESDTNSWFYGFTKKEGENIKILALLIACLLWLFFLSLLRINLNFSYSLNNLASDIVLEFRVLFSNFKIKLNIPKEMLSSGFLNIFVNIWEDVNVTEENNEDKKVQKNREYTDNLDSTESKDSKLSQENVKKQEIDQQRNMQANEEKTKKRYVKAEKTTREVFRHYVFSLSRLLSLKKKAALIRKYLYKKVNILSLDAGVEVGGRDAAETGWITGAIWTFFGQMSARLYHLVTVKENKIRYAVTPCFNDETFSCNLHCILNIKISHIIATGYKFLLLIYKNRRTRNYGRTSN